MKYPTTTIRKALVKKRDTGMKVVGVWVDGCQANVSNAIILKTHVVASLALIPRYLLMYQDQQRLFLIHIHLIHSTHTIHWIANVIEKKSI